MMCVVIIFYLVCTLVGISFVNQAWEDVQKVTSLKYLRAIIHGYNLVAVVARISVRFVWR